MASTDVLSTSVVPKCAGSVSALYALDAWHVSASLEHLDAAFLASVGTLPDVAF